MGKLFIEFLESPHLTCKMCKTCIVNLSDMLYDKVETVHGLASGYIVSYNILYSTTKTNGSFKTFCEYGGMFDYDSPFNTYDTYICRAIYCKVCMMHLGWSIEELQIILDSVVT